MNGMLYDSSLGIFDRRRLEELPTYYCDCCGYAVDGEVFEFDGYLYCSISCLTKETDINYGDVYELK